MPDTRVMEQWAVPLIGAWREVGRHLELEACLDGVHKQLRRALPVEHLLVRHLDAATATLETVAVAPWSVRVEGWPRRLAMRPPQVSRLSTWIDEGRAAVLDPKLHSELIDVMWPVRTGATLVAAPIDDSGVFLVIAGTEALADSLPFIALLREPLGVAWRNNLRIQEMARLREAAEADNRALLSRLARDAIADDMVGASSGLREVMLRVEQVAPTDASVLILGETGSGKEVVARAIHGRSQRAAGPFLRVNCGAIPAELIDSELFGHERGSFTGAVDERRGWFERADGGTLFLDELAELPLAAQVRLLRVLQDGSFERVGGQRTLYADVRVLAATSSDLHQRMVVGGFREDLWYRLSVFPIEIPPLRDRLEDIPELALHFSERAGQRLFGRVLPLSRTDLDLLCEYGWPGNVRELAAVIERAAILGGGQRLDVGAALGGAWRSREKSTRGKGAGLATAETLDDAQRRAIERALVRCEGRIEGEFGAASALGVPPSTLRSRMKRMNIAHEGFRKHQRD